MHLVCGRRFVGECLKKEAGAGCSVPAVRFNLADWETVHTLPTLFCQEAVCQCAELQVFLLKHAFKTLLCFVGPPLHTMHKYRKDACERPSYDSVVQVLVSRHVWIADHLLTEGPLQRMISRYPLNGGGWMEMSSYGMISREGSLSTESSLIGNLFVFFFQSKQLETT